MINKEGENNHLSLIKNLVKSPIVMIIAGSILLLPAIYHFIKELNFGILEIFEIAIGSSVIIEGLMKLWFGEIRIKERQFKKCNKVHESGKFKYILLYILYFVILSFIIIAVDNFRKHVFIFDGLKVFDFIAITLFACLCGFLLGMLYWEKSERSYQKYIDENKE